MSNEQILMPNLTETVLAQLVYDCKKEIAHLQEHIAICERQRPPVPTVKAMSMLLRQQITLATLTAKPFGWTTGKPHRDTGDATIKNADKEGRFPLFTLPPVLVLKTITLPRLFLSACTKGEVEEMRDVRKADIKAIQEAGYQVVERTA